MFSTIKIPSWLRAITTKARKKRKCPPLFLPIRHGKIIVDTCKDIFVPGMNWQVTGTTSILVPQKVHCIQMKSIFFEDILQINFMAFKLFSGSLMSEDEALNKLILKIYLTDLCSVGVRESCFFKKGFQEYVQQKIFLQYFKKLFLFHDVRKIITLKLLNYQRWFLLVVVFNVLFAFNLKIFKKFYQQYVEICQYFTYLYWSGPPTVSQPHQSGCGLLYCRTTPKITSVAS